MLHLNLAGMADRRVMAGVEEEDVHNKKTVTMMGDRLFI
jgi:hypothetical protein